MKIKISIADITLFAELNNSKTAKLIEHNLPIEAQAELWGKEVYFYIKPKMGLEAEYSHEVVEEGDLGYWPQGPCFCLFFGLTPNSRGGKIMPASSVNVFGKIIGDFNVLNKAKDKDKIRIEKA